MAAFFSQVRYKNGPQNYAQYNKEETVYLAPDSEVRQPRTGAVMKCKPLGGEPLEVSGDEDRREKLVDWLVSPSNPFFAREAVNRIWYHLMGRGIVEPVDDLRDTNPPASAELLEALADDFVAHGFDVKRTIRLIANSRVYQLSSLPNRVQRRGRALFLARDGADAVGRAVARLGVAGHRGPREALQPPAGSRAAQVPDGELVHPFLKDFGQPARADACECERGTDSTLEQALQIVGGRTLHKQGHCPGQPHRQAAEGRCGRRHARGSAFPGHALAPSRRGGARARRVRARRPGHADARRRAAEDLFWTLLNHPEFLFQH